MTPAELVQAAGHGQGDAPNIREKAQAQLLVHLTEAVRAQTASTESSSVTMAKLTLWLVILTVLLTILGVLAVALAL